MTVLDVHQIPLDEIHHLGHDLAQAIDDDRDELAQHRSLAAVDEPAQFFDTDA